MFDFPTAIAGVLKCEYWRRQDWGRAAYITSTFSDDHHAYQIIMKMKDGRSNAFVPNQYDMHAHDWVRVDS